MERRKVRIYKDPNQGNKTKEFLAKAEMGMQMPRNQMDPVDLILDELTLDPDTEAIADKLQAQFGMSYQEAMQEIDDVVSMLYKKDEAEGFIPTEEQEEEIQETAAPKYDYGLDETSVVDDANWEGETGWEDEDDLAMEDDQALSLGRKGGTISKKKFVKDTVRKLRKAADGMEQESANTSSILDKPLDGRESLVNNFRRGIKDLGNQHYAKEIYDKTMELNQEVDSLPNPFSQEIPMAKKGREQKDAAKEIRKADKDWQRAYGDIAAGYFGVPGMPNYLQMIVPSMVSPQVPQANVMPSSGAPGPLIDFSYKKGPWWSGKREWSASGIPAGMLMGMGQGFGYMPQTMSYDNTRMYPGEIIRRKSKVSPDLLPKEDGGQVLNPEMDAYGNLERFVYGGDDLPSPVIEEYENNDMMTKDVDDPFMFRDGGLYKYQGTGNSQVNNDYNTWLRQKAEKEALAEYNEWMNRTGGDAANMVSYQANPNDQVYQQILQRKMGSLAGQTQQPGMGVRNQVVQNQGVYPRGFTPQMSGRYPTAPSVGQQLRAMLSPTYNPQTGKNYDFMWASQSGPIRTLDGRIYQPPQGSGAPNMNIKDPSGKSYQQYIDWYNSLGTPEEGTSRSAPLSYQEWSKEQMAENPNQGMQTPPGGYMYDYKFEKGPWWSGKRTTSITGRWVDPNNPNRTTTGAQGSTTKNDIPVGSNTNNTNLVTGNQGNAVLDASGNQLTSDGSNMMWNSGNMPSLNNLKPEGPQGPASAAGTQRPAGPASTDAQEKLSRRERLSNAAGNGNLKNVRKFGPDMINYRQANNEYNEGRKNWQAQVRDDVGDPGQRNDYYSTNVTPAFEKVQQYNQSTDDYYNNTSNRDKRKNFREWKRGVLTEQEFGGYMPNYDDLYRFQGMDDSIVNSGTGPYDPNANTQYPEDFVVNYDINKARTLNTGNVANLTGLVSTGIQEVDRAGNNLYQDNYLYDNLTSDNRAPINYIDDRGRVSGLNQRIMSKGQGAGSTGFTGIVKEGGELKYQEGGIYEMDEAEIGRILAAGGQIEFI